MRRFVFTFAAVANLLLVDQFSKEAAIAFLRGNSPLEILSFFNLAYVENRGCAWGLFQGHTWPLAIFGLVALVILLLKRRSVFPSGWLGAVAETLLYTGIIGNLIDRIYRGCVIDFFDFHFAAYHFPCFNVADSFITVAVALLVGASFFSGSGKKESVRS